MGKLGFLDIVYNIPIESTTLIPSVRITACIAALDPAERRSYNAATLGVER
jgi:hypothetical protein